MYISDKIYVVTLSKLLEVLSEPFVVLHFCMLWLYVSFCLVSAVCLVCFVCTKRHKSHLVMLGAWNAGTTEEGPELGSFILRMFLSLRCGTACSLRSGSGLRC